MSANRPDLTKLSKFLSLILRHAPERAGLTLDVSGWTPVDDLLKALKGRGWDVSPEMLQGLVKADSKGRYAFSTDGKHIRANQGHSVEVDLGLSPVEPPEELYHGTVERLLDAILSEGLMPMERHHVHLSGDVQTATAVGSRRGKPVILVVNTKAMREVGHKFYQSANRVWLTETVPPSFLTMGSVPLSNGETRPRKAP